MKLVQKRAWSILLTIALVVTMLPSTVNAQEQGTVTEATNPAEGTSQVTSSTSAQDMTTTDSANTDTSTQETEATTVTAATNSEEPTTPLDAATSTDAVNPEEQTTSTDAANPEDATTAIDSANPAQTSSPEDVPATTASITTNYMDENGISQPITASLIDEGTTSLDGSITDGYYTISGDIVVNHTLSISGDVKLILADNASLTVIGEAGHAGIEVTINNSVSIYSQSGGNGTLITTGGTGGAGIGGLASGIDLTKQVGTIRIYGGDIRATGGTNGAGIGNGSGCGKNNINIYGGTIKAVGGVNGSGIGAATNWNGFGNISVYGGTIQAIRGDNFRLDIGGYGESSDRITVNGGTIFGSEPDGYPNLVLGDIRGFADIIVNGGSIRANGITGLARNDAGQEVFSNKLTIPVSASGSITAASINNISCANIPDTTHGVYGIKDVSTNINGMFCFFLPESNNVEPVKIELDHSSNYWAAYTRNEFLPEITLKQLRGPAIYPEEGGYASFMPADIILVKNDFGSSFAGVYNGNTSLVQGTDYTISGDTITLKSNYLNTLPAGFCSLSFDYGVGSNNPTFRLSVIHASQYIAVDDGMSYESGLSDASHKSYGALVANDFKKSFNILSETTDSGMFLRIFDSPNMTGFLSNAEVISLNIGTYDLYSTVFGIIGNELNCDSDPLEIQSQLVNLVQNDQATLNTALTNLSATDGTGLTNNNEVQSKINSFSGNFQGIISKIKTYAPNAKIYVTNLYNPYKGISIPYAGGTLDLGAIMDTYIQTLNATFDQNSTDYTLIDTYSAFSSPNGGTSLVNADGATYNLDPFPNEEGHAKLAELILAKANNDLNPTVTVSSVSLSQSELNLTKNDTATLSATVLPSNASNKGITWSSSNASVASVDNTGKVTALSAGSAVITVTTQDQGKTATCNVTVKESQTVPVNPPKDTPTDVPKDVPKDTPTDAPKDVPQNIPDKVAPILISQLKVNKSSITLAKKATVTLSATAKPDNAANKNVTWSSSDASIATVSSTGTITAVSAGKATITATAQDGSNITAICEVTVPKNTSYKIKYKLNKGINAATNPSYYASGVKLKLEKPTRSKYTFTGWYLDDNKVTSISKSTKGDITLTAKWQKVSVAKTTVKKVKNDKPSALSVSYDKVSGAKGYTVYYSTNKDMSDASQLDVSSKKGSATISNLVNGSTYYVTVKAYKTDSLGERVYGKSNKTIKVVIKK